MRAQRLAWSLAQHTSTAPSLFSTTSSRAANHRAWLAASSLRPSYQSRSITSSQVASKPSTGEPEPEDATVAKYIRRTPTQPGTTDEPFDTNSNSDPIVPPPMPTETLPRWGAPTTLRRRQIPKHNADIASLMGSTGRAQNNRGTKTLDADDTSFYMNLRQPLSPTAQQQNRMASIMMADLTGGTYDRFDPPPPMRVDPFMGRAAYVNRTNQPLGRALTQLNAALRQNQIKEQVRLQKFHERPGIKRKRLKSQRWRKRFFVGFKHMIAKVKEMKAQGW